MPPPALHHPQREFQSKTLQEVAGLRAGLAQHFTSLEPKLRGLSCPTTPPVRGTMGSLFQSDSSGSVEEEQGGPLHPGGCADGRGGGEWSWRGFTSWVSIL